MRCSCHVQPIVLQVSTHAAHICTSQVCRGTFVSKTISKMLTAMMTPMTVLSKSLDMQCLAKHCEFLWYPAEDVWGLCGIRYTGYTSPFLAKKKRTDVGVLCFSGYPKQDALRQTHWSVLHYISSKTSEISTVSTIVTILNPRSSKVCESTHWAMKILTHHDGSHRTYLDSSLVVGEVLVFAESTGLITKPFPLDQFRDKTTMDMGSKLGPKNPVPGPKVWCTPMDMDMRLRKSGYFTFKTFQNWCWFLYGCKLKHVGFSSVFTAIFPGSPGFFFQKKRVRPPVPHTSISTRWPCHLHPSRASCCPPCSEGNPSPWSNIKIFTVS